MAVSGVTNTTTTTAATTATTSATPGGELDKNAFLKLLIAQMSNQDPLDPMEDQEFIAEMATFSTLEEMQNMNTTLSTISDSLRFSATSYIGKAVAFTNSDGETVAGIVNAVWFEGNDAVLETTEGQISLNEINGVADVE